MSSDGWVSTDELLSKLAATGKRISLDRLKEIVETNDKKRFAFSDDESRIRASQGHSIEIDLKLEPATPPSNLFHGTSTRFLDTILREGLNKMNRQHVHLTSDPVTARKVGQRHGKPTILEIAASRMTEAGHIFWRSENNVWLTTEVAPCFIKLQPEDT